MIHFFQPYYMISNFFKHTILKFQFKAQNHNKTQQENLIQNLITIITKPYKIWIRTADKAAVLFSRAGGAF